MDSNKGLTEKIVQNIQIPVFLIWIIKTIPLQNLHIKNQHMIILQSSRTYCHAYICRILYKIISFAYRRNMEK